MKKSNTTLALIAAIASSASMTYAATDNGAQKKWLPGRIMSGSVTYKNGNVSNGGSTCTIYTYDDKGRYVEIETKKYNKDTDSFDNSDLTSYEYDETTGKVSLLVQKIYDSEVGDTESDVKTVARYKADGSQKSKKVTTNHYSDYKEIIPNAITRITNDALYPRRVYTTDGVFVGNSTDYLPSGVYIVREGGHSMKVKR